MRRAIRVKWYFIALAGSCIANPTIAQQVSHHASIIPVVGSALPNEGGEAGFAAISEIVSLLDKDPSTDWQRVNIDALHAHLRDMNAISALPKVESGKVDRGIVIRIRRSMQGFDSVERIVTAHASVLAAGTGWESHVVNSEDGLVWTVTSKTPAAAQKIKALGFFGLLAVGDHHRFHHLAIARGAATHH